MEERGGFNEEFNDYLDEVGAIAPRIPMQNKTKNWRLTGD
jgi:hypothetical protein